MANSEPSGPRRSFGDLLVDESPDALFAVTLDGRVLSWNRAAHAIFGYTGDEAVGRPVSMLTVPDDRRDEALDTLAHVFEHGSSLIETVRRRKDGSLLQVAESMRRVHVRDGGDFIAVSTKDVTALERVRFDRRMQEATRLKSELLANMSHELRTPLNDIIGFAELMHRSKAGPLSAPHHEYVGDILTSAKHLRQLIDDVLDLANVEHADPHDA